MAFIIGVIIVIYFILIAWTWHSLGFIEKPKKIAFILIGMLVMYLISLFIFQMTKGQITYEKPEMQQSVQTILTLIFAGINGILAMPQIGKILDQINENQIDKTKTQKRIIILAIVFILCLIFEVGYMKDTQEGILTMYHTVAK